MPYGKSRPDRGGHDAVDVEPQHRPAPPISTTATQTPALIAAPVPFAPSRSPGEAPRTRPRCWPRRTRRPARSVRAEHLQDLHLHRGERGQPAADPGAEQRPPVARQRQPFLQPGHEVPEQERRHDVHRERRPRPRGRGVRERLGERGPRQGPERAAREDRRDRPPVRPRHRDPPAGRRGRTGIAGVPANRLGSRTRTAPDAAGSGTRKTTPRSRGIGAEAISRSCGGSGSCASTPGHHLAFADLTGPAGHGAAVDSSAPRVIAADPGRFNRRMSNG